MKSPPLLKLILFGLSLFIVKICYPQDIDISQLSAYSNNDCPHTIWEKINQENYYCLEGFSIFYNKERNLTETTFHILQPSQINIPINQVPAKRRSNFQPVLIDGKLTMTNYYYSNSGYDRGHLVPAGDFAWDQHLKDETFFHFNILHQNATLNRGIWALMESQIRDKVIRENSKAFIYTGAYFDEGKIDEVGNMKADIAEAFYKIIFIPAINKIYAWFIPNGLSYYESLENYQVSVDQLEYLIEIDFFELLDDDREQLLESEIFRFE